MKKIILILISAILIACSFCVFILYVKTINNPGEVQSLFGFKPLLIVSESMKGTIEKDDLVIGKSYNGQKLNVGDIVFYKHDDMVIVHRITEITTMYGKDVVKTKGDNNKYEDNWYTAFDEIIGVYSFRVANIGKIKDFLLEPEGLAVTLSIPSFIIILIGILDLKPYVEEKDIYIRSKRVTITGVVGAVKRKGV